MNNAIWISLVGAGLVILGLIILWLLMDVLVRVTSTKKKKEIVDDKTDSQEIDFDLECKKMAAAASIAVSIALLNTSFLSSRLKNEQGMSSWQIAHRNEQIHNKVELPYKNRCNK